MAVTASFIGGYLFRKIQHDRYVRKRVRRDIKEIFGKPDYCNPFPTEREKKLVNALIESVRLIRGPDDWNTFMLYYEGSPEMSRIREQLRSYGLTYGAIMSYNKFIL